MVPMAAADSINPCAFAVMLLLLSTIFSKSKSRKKTIAAGLLFSLAIFLSYLLIGMGFYKVLQSAVSPMGAFVIGILVSLFLLPCSSGPYFVVLGLLKSENVSIAGLGF